jgi:SAM-dependent methyltransferase
MELLLGCGSARDKRIYPHNREHWEHLVTSDNNIAHEPDVVCDLTRTPWPWDDNTFDEVHAYEVLEHLGQQGDYVAFFEQFTEIWRILKPDGLFCASVPSLDSPWLWGDPSHTRVIAPQTLVFLDQEEYGKQVGRTAMSDFRYLYHADFRTVWKSHEGESFCFVLQAKKSPSS